MGIDGLSNRSRIRPRMPLPVAHCPIGGDDARALQQRTAEFLNVPARFESEILGLWESTGS